MEGSVTTGFRSFCFLRVSGPVVLWTQLRLLLYGVGIFIFRLFRWLRPSCPPVLLVGGRTLFAISSAPPLDAYGRLMLAGFSVITSVIPVLSGQRTSGFPTDCTISSKPGRICGPSSITTCIAPVQVSS